ncbi:MAG TPA: RNA polymerase sigma factor [Thermoanaerobaculia bacterium]|jgi:RNA polymerase sigma-70 factor (ECF subfamily)|nr:RNA polymerase sigma factor [Thermoanaerobaculia bacterium]
MEFESVYREERPRALATLIRLLGDFDLAEDSLQEAFAAALEQWPSSGVPRNPRAWLVSGARHKAIDRLRREKSFAAKRREIAYEIPTAVPPPEIDEEPFSDDLMRLIFTCCHPALAVEAQVALTLKTLCGLSVEEIARAFLVSSSTMAQRLVRAKAKIRAARVPYAVPTNEELAERLEGVLRVVYLVFNEGYAATSGDELVRRELCAEAIRLGRLVWVLFPAESEVAGLLGLMLIQDSRRSARVDGNGEIVTLEEQDRTLWDRDEIAEGQTLAETALRRGGAGFYAIQAAIAALHAQAARAEDTDWPQIAALYALLLRLHPSPVVALNHAAAVAMGNGLQRGLRLIEELEATGELDGYYLLPAAKADVLRRLGRHVEAATAYEQALSLVTHAAERRYLQRRLREVQARG